MSALASCHLDPMSSWHGDPDFDSDERARFVPELSDVWLDGGLEQSRYAWMTSLTTTRQQVSLISGSMCVRVCIGTFLLLICKGTFLLVESDEW